VPPIAKEGRDVTSETPDDCEGCVKQRKSRYDPGEKQSRPCCYGRVIETEAEERYREAERGAPRVAEEDFGGRKIEK
jgi:hypothetical protein